MKYIAILICLPLFNITNSFSFNLTNLMMHQLTMCGPLGFCNITQFNFKDLNILKMQKSHKLCPNCFCDNLCFGRGDCCPDKFFAFTGLVCDNVTFVNATQDKSRDQRSSFLAIKNCPYGTEQAKAKKCEHEYEDSNKLKYPPVTSQKSNITYANRFCAQCHDETSYQLWNMDIYCKEFLDINFFSSSKEVIDSGIENRCVMQFVPHQDKPAFNCLHLKHNHFDSCNKTGFWKTRDDDVLNACESIYVNNDTLFKNSFCKMCNPTFYKGRVITECNVTGLWDFFDKSIKQACSRFELNEGTLPFKNIFCRICNAPENMRDSYVDASAEVKIEVLLNMKKTNVYYTTIKMNKFLKGYFEFVKNEITESEQKMKEKNQTLNMTKLVYKLFSMKKFVRVCRNYGIPKNLSSLILPCSCEPSCFQHGGCCEDFALQYPTGCIHSQALAGMDFKRRYPNILYLVTNGCFMQSQYHMYLEKFCRQGGNDNILTSHPVFDENTGMSYLNIFCYMCNKPPNQPDFELGKPWDIEIYCDKYIEHRNFLTVNHLIKTIIETNCDVTYTPSLYMEGKNTHKTAVCHSNDPRIINRCNYNGKWQDEDPDIKYACENVLPMASDKFHAESDTESCENTYKNVFCAICNPKVTKDIITISECLYTEGHSLYDEQNVIGCEFFPQVHFNSPFKNEFCKRCNGAYNSSVLFGDAGDSTCPYYDPSDDFREPLFSISLDWYPIYRNLFVFSDYDEVLLEIESPTCKSTQAYISTLKQCRNLTCYPGKFLHNGSCRALFTVTKNLGYYIALNYRGNVSSLLPVQDLLVIISKEIKQTIMSDLQIGSDSIEYLFILIDQPCFKKNQQFSVTIAVGIFIKQAVGRVDIEKRLIAITTKMLISRNETFYLQLSLSSKRTNHLHFKSHKIFLAENSSRCTLKEYFKNKVVANRQKYRTVRISKLLTCVQVSLDFDEYHIDQQSGKLTVYGMDKVFDSDLFDNLPNGSARICAEDFSAKTDTVTFSSHKRNQDFLLSKITLILNVISILCLMISFLIYVFKKDLRTMPGKINMVLILSLVLTLTVFQLSKFGTSQKVACAGFGVAAHYFWLMSFSSMTVSSFHMYRIFKFSNINSSNDFNDILRVYVVFITIFPCLVVLLNIMVSWQVSGIGNIGYGNDRMCFIDNPYSRLASFIIPLGVMCICSFFFFVSTIISIKRVPNVPGNQSIRNEFGIFCRLFTITGISWALQIIDGFLPFSTFSYISSIINSLQGTAIFIAFILNKRVMNCKCTARNDSHNKTLAKRELTENSNMDVTRL